MRQGIEDGSSARPARLFVCCVLRPGGEGFAAALYSFLVGHFHLAAAWSTTSAVIHTNAASWIVREVKRTAMAPFAPEARCALVCRSRAATTTTDNTSSVGECAPVAWAASTIAANTGRFSMQLAWARTTRRYNGGPCGSSPGKLFNSALPARMSDHRCMPTPSARIVIVHIANASTAKAGMFIVVPH